MAGERFPEFIVRTSGTDMRSLRWVALLVGLVGAGFALYRNAGVGVAAFGIGFGIVFFVVFTLGGRKLDRNIQPALIMDDKGLLIAGYPKLRWREIEDFHLTRQGGTIPTTLKIKVAGADAFEPAVGALRAAEIARIAGQTIGVTVVELTASPAMIEAEMKRRWTDRFIGER